MFGGMTPWAANLSSVIKQWRHGQGRDRAWHNKLPESAYLTVRALSDLWQRVRAQRARHNSQHSRSLR